MIWWTENYFPLSEVIVCTLVLKGFSSSMVVASSQHQCVSASLQRRIVINRNFVLADQEFNLFSAINCTTMKEPCSSVSVWRVIDYLGQYYVSRDYNLLCVKRWISVGESMTRKINWMLLPLLVLVLDQAVEGIRPFSDKSLQEQGDSL